MLHPFYFSWSIGSKTRLSWTSYQRPLIVHSNTFLSIHFLRRYFEVSSKHRHLGYVNYMKRCAGIKSKQKGAFSFQEVVVCLFHLFRYSLQKFQDIVAILNAGDIKLCHQIQGRVTLSLKRP